MPDKLDLKIGTRVVNRYSGKRGVLTSIGWHLEHSKDPYFNAYEVKYIGLFGRVYHKWEDAYSLRILEDTTDA